MGACCIAQGAQLVLCDVKGVDGWGGREVQEGRDICIHIAI